MHQDGFTSRSPLRAETFVGSAIIEVAIHKIGDDFDGTLDVELFESLIEEVAGDGGDAVTLLDGKLGDGEITAVAADQGDVRAVKRGDEGKTARRGHGTREQGADGVGNRVVYVQKVQRLGFENFEHFCSQRQRVRRMVEQRIGGDFDFVEMDARSLGFMRIGGA